MDYFDSLKLLLAFYKDKVQGDLLKRLTDEYQRVLVADADARRRKKSGMIMNMVDLQICLDKFKLTYSAIQRKCGNVPAIDRKIKEMERQIREFSYMKNR